MPITLGTYKSVAERYGLDDEIRIVYFPFDDSAVVNKLKASIIPTLRSVNKNNPTIFVIGGEDYQVIYVAKDGKVECFDPRGSGELTVASRVTAQLG